MKIRLENVSKSLSFKEHFNARAEVLHLLEGINYELDDGENLAILGQSGSGKSTLAKLISFSEPKSGGKIYINDKEITDKNELKKDIRYILQNQKQALNPALKVKTAIAHVRSYLKLSFSENELKELLTNLNLKDEILEKYPSQLSGGEATRVGILLALLSKPKILICDEITSGLDNETKQKIINLLLSLDEKISIIFITHDILSAMKIAQKVLIIEASKQVAFGKFDDLVSQNVLKKYLDAAKFYDDKL
ncbi:Oligopeptide transport ATP-binding protein OppF [Campylobacter concisus UNSWCS]|uniref:Oligopeptide transport ATP-binding protein OppF n=1 Tax=Campylobacter concisus UNSWCS TaxID=1242968 RepID=U2GH34_9BACT|nr:ATP-binding cassette domain-containing protein [Campylobacter concisus]ERJ27399.1 Oligopeptide transport ATP-binding protein OppF [Campylobacter concisus UNSWCS]